MATRALAVGGASFLLLAACSDEPPPLCDAAELADALANARSGETVRLGSCRTRGSFVVPAGVTLAGEGRDVSIIESALGADGKHDTGAMTVYLEPATEGSPTRIEGLAIESFGAFGIGTLGEGLGSVEIEAVDVRAERGIGLGAQDLSGVVMTDVTLTGDITAETAQQLADESQWAAYGVILLRVGQSELGDVTATGFLKTGVALVESSTIWSGGGAPRNAGAGVSQWDGEADLEGLDLGGTIDAGLVAASGGVFLNGARVESAGLRVDEGGGFGLFQFQATAAHVDLVATSNVRSAVWAQDCDSLEMSGGAGMLSGNAGAGVVVMGTPTVRIAGATIADATSWETVVQQGDEQGTSDVADGVQISGLGEGMTLTLESLRVAGNARVGLLVDLMGGPAEITTSDVTVTDVRSDGSDPDEGELGAIVENGDAPGGWDSGVTREGETEANDPPEMERLVAGGIPIGVVQAIVSPCNLVAEPGVELRQSLGIPR